jgi:hypothetical protein
MEIFESQHVLYTHTFIHGDIAILCHAIHPLDAITAVLPGNLYLFVWKPPAFLYEHNIADT